MKLECRRCGDLFDGFDDSEGPPDYCPQCRYEYVHQYDEPDSAGDS